MSKGSSTRYYQKTKNGFKKGVCERNQDLS